MAVNAVVGRRSCVAGMAPVTLDPVLMKRLAVFAAMLSLAAVLRAEPRESFPLWPGAAPGALGQTTNDIPMLTPYLPEPGTATGA